jgi:L-arabinokinase
MERSKVLCYYITGHGYGHATRVIGQVKHLLDRNYVIHIISSLDPTFLTANIINESNADKALHLHCHRRVLDAGAVQLDPLHIDIEQSLSNYLNHIHFNHSSLVAHERKFLLDVHADLVLVDATPLPCSAAKAASIPSIIVSNFTWDVTYQFLLDVVRSKLSDDDVAKYASMVEQASIDVCNAEYYLRLPGITPLPPQYHGKVIPGPLICRKANQSREQIRESLNIPNSAYMLILGFGGFKLSGSWALRDESLPPNWICIVLGSEGDSMPSNRYITVPKDVYVPNLIGAADAVSRLSISDHI